MNAEMTHIEGAIIEKLRTLPPDKQQEVLDFVEFIQQRAQPKQPRQSVKGLWKNLLDGPITAEDIDESRCEMLGDFPREDIVL